MTSCNLPYFAKEHDEMRAKVREFAREVVSPVARKHDADATFPWATVKQMADLGLLGIPWPRQLGGSGGDLMSFIIAIHEMAKVDASHSITISAHTTLGTSPIVNFGTDEQRERFVPPLASGRVLGGFGLTEESAGSDAGGTRTTAVRRGGCYVLNGSERYSSSRRSRTPPPEAKGSARSSSPRRTAISRAQRSSESVTIRRCRR
jgi:alkylation response protein AidB-like acyl-CoA dehydrogenase